MGRSRGGLSTKIHLASINESCSVALHLTPGQAHDGRQFEVLYQSLDPDNVLQSTSLDRGYDADRIRGRNRIERLINKLKHFRRIATRYDKLSKSFFAALCLVATFILLRNS